MPAWFFLNKPRGMSRTPFSSCLGKKFSTNPLYLSRPFPLLPVSGEIGRCGELAVARPHRSHQLVRSQSHTLWDQPACAEPPWRLVDRSVVQHPRCEIGTTPSSLYLRVRRRSGRSPAPVPAQGQSEAGKTPLLEDEGWAASREDREVSRCTLHRLAGGLVAPPSQMAS